MKEKNNMDKKVTYILEIRSAYNEIKKAISYNFTNKKPLYIAKNENDDNIDGTLEYLADITKIKALDDFVEENPYLNSIADGFITHANGKEQITEVKTDG